MRKLFRILFFLALSLPGFSQDVFFNEVNYLPSNDTWFEIAGPAGEDLSGWDVVLYDNVGVPYDTIHLNEVLPSTQGCNGIVVVDGSVLLTAPGSGMALVNTTPTVVKYISYGGATTAVSGQAAGLTSQNIGTQLVDNLSLQLIGTGLTYGDFNNGVDTWAIPVTGATQNAVNTGQTFLACGLGTLPVELVHFSGEPTEKNIELTWHTASEVNHDFFNLMHSTDGIRFRNIGKIEEATNGSSSLKRYEFTFYSPKNGGNYFRLDQVDNDGTVNKSNVIYVDFKGLEHPIFIYPNPAQDRIKVVLDDYVYTENLSIQIIDGQGKEVLTKNVEADDLNSLDISYLENGVYFLRIHSAQSNWQTIFIKQNME